MNTFVICCAVMLAALLDSPPSSAPPAAKEQSAPATAEAATSKGEPNTPVQPSPAAAKKDPDLLQIEANVVSYTNAQRARYGLPPLTVDHSLMKSARSHCSWMTRNRIFQHTRRAVAENIAMGQSNSQEVVRTWMNSSGHRANILNPNHRRIGVSAYRTASGTIYWCQQFTR